MTFADHLSNRSGFASEAPRRSAAAGLLRAAHPVVVIAKRIYPDVLVLATLGVLLTAMVALRVLIWVPLFHAKP
jgi:hypothetical protein